MKHRIFPLLLSVATLPVLCSRGDVVIDDFNAQRSYPECCDALTTNAFGTYLSFASNLTQSGSNGTLRIDRTATDNGGFFHDGGTQVLWDFTGQTNLVMTAKLLAGNGVELLDCASRYFGWISRVRVFAYEFFFDFI